jgi:hypothetical protein
MLATKTAASHLFQDGISLLLKRRVSLLKASAEVRKSRAGKPSETHRSSASLELSSHTIFFALLEIVAFGGFAHAYDYRLDPTVQFELCRK